MVKFEAPEHTKGPLAGYAVVGRWTTTRCDPDWRGEVGYQEFTYAHHWVPQYPLVGPAVDAATAVEQALWEWRQWRHPDHVSVDAVYQSSLSGPAGSDHDPFVGVEGTGHDGYDPSGRSKQRGKVGG